MQRFRNILVVCDEASAYEHAFERVAWLAKANDADLTLVDTVDVERADLGALLAKIPGFSGRARAIEDDITETHQERLDTLSEPLRSQGLRIKTRVLTGTPFIAIIREVLRHGYDLVVKGAHRAPGQPFFGGPDMHLIRKCPCPVWVLNSAAEPRSSRILAAITPDLRDVVRNDLSRMVMQLSTSLARQDEARLDVLKIWRLEEENTLRHGRVRMQPDEVDQLVAQAEQESKTALDGFMDEFSEFDDISRVLHIKGIAADVIAQHVEDEGIDTIVMGSVGRVGVSGLIIGNTAETIINRVKCSLLTVKPSGFVSPVTLDDTEDTGNG